MTEQEKFFKTLNDLFKVWGILGLIALVVLGVSLYQDYQSDLIGGVNITRISSFTNNITVGDGSGLIEFYCPTDEFIIHIGNATMKLRNVNGTIIMEGVQMGVPLSK